jgi:hypothetical protein
MCAIASGKKPRERGKPVDFYHVLCFVAALKAAQSQAAAFSVIILLRDNNRKLI